MCCYKQGFIKSFAIWLTFSVLRNRRNYGLRAWDICTEP